MTNQDVLDDLEHATRIAREGAETPLLGGPVGLLWGALLTITFAGQYLILERVLAMPDYSLAILWIGFAAIGGVGTALLSRRINSKPGATSAANRVESYVWIMFASLMASLAVGIILNQIFSGGDYRLWDFMVIVGFAGQGLAYGVVAKMMREQWIHLAALAGFIMSAVCFSAYGSNQLYLIAAIATIFTVILPSIRTMKAAG